ncbi:MAG TPA: Flp pilus assembly protein CpaB [Stellaceae bacterium]|nr:Flp pilus assembly protein CpaB [Stellaceae bacterium]
MPYRRLLFVLIALCVAVASIYVDRTWLRSKPVAEAAPPPAQHLTQVLVARGNLPAGQFVRPENVRWQIWPEGDIAADYITDNKSKVEDYIGAIVRSGLSDGEPVTERRVVRPGDRGFMAAVLTPGYRAITVSVTVSSGIAGFVFPGDRVDLLLTLAVPGASDGKVQHRASETLLTNMRVLAVDQRADDQSKEIVVAKTATLEVTPKQAETIAVSSELGQLSLSLRSLATPTDDAGIEDSQRFSHTWDSDATHLVPPPGQSEGGGFKVSVSHGDKVQEIDFARSGK